MSDTGKKKNTYILLILIRVLLLIVKGTFREISVEGRESGTFRLHGSKAQNGLDIFFSAVTLHREPTEQTI